MDEKIISCFRQMTYGIYVLTCAGKAKDLATVMNGMIASWVTQVSYEPPMVMVAVHPNRYSHTLLEENPFFGLHLLDDTQKDLLKRFKGPDPAKKFNGIPFTVGKTGVPILKHCIGWLECEIKETLAPGNHTLFIGRVVRAGFNGAARPLCTLDYEGCYLGKS